MLDLTPSFHPAATRVRQLLLCTPSSDRPELEFRASGRRLAVIAARADVGSAAGSCAGCEACHLRFNVANGRIASPELFLKLDLLPQ